MIVSYSKNDIAMSKIRPGRTFFHQFSVFDDTISILL